MKMYVDELPKSCSECPLTMVHKDSFTKKYVLCCRCINVNVDKCKNYRTNLCPLQSLTDYTKQVRKEVCDKIRDLAGDYWTIPLKKQLDYDGNEIMALLTMKDFDEILDQI